LPPFGKLIQAAQKSAKPLDSPGRYNAFDGNVRYSMAMFGIRTRVCRFSPGCGGHSAAAGNGGAGWREHMHFDLSAIPQSDAYKLFYKR
jgi:hypothetical protein